MTRSRIKRQIEVSAGSADAFQRRFPAFGRLGLITEAMAKRFKELPLDGIIIGDQDFERTCGLLGASLPRALQCARLG